ncbi:MAG: LacI family DNA-binding transcriptional regulator [Flexilinea sp.]
MRATIKDIAEDTGFSITTISLVLNNKATSIPKATKEIIIKSAKDHGYRPNQLAVGLLKKQTKTIGLIISDIRNVFFSTLAKAIEDECHRNGRNLILCNSNDEHQRDIDYINVLADKGVDGIIYGMSLDTDYEKAIECYKLMDELHLPFVMVDRYFDSLNYFSVSTDHYYGGYLAAKHLIDRGYRRIACVTGPKHLQDSKDRLNGYKTALQEVGIHYDPEIIYEGQYTVNSGAEAMELMKDKDISAIFAFNDMTAFGVYNYAKKLNISIPNDIALVGYDDIFFSEILEVPLTTVHQPITEMGVASVQLLLSLTKGEKIAKRNISLKPTLIIRKSTGIL